MASLNDALAGGTCQFFEDEGVAGGRGVGSEVVDLLEPDYVWRCNGCFGDGDLNDRVILLSGYEQDFFEKVMWAVALDKGNDEVLLGFRGGVPYSHSRTFAEVGVVPDIEVGLGEVLGLDDRPVVLFDR